MKKCLIACALALLMTATPVAAEWKEGRSPAQPYAGVPEVDLSQTMGYIMMYPRTKMPAEHFCDKLEIYLPREDVKLGDGTLRLYGKDGEILSVKFSESDLVELRPLNDIEMEGLMWGGGTAIVITLPVSFTIGESYYVTMEEGCFTAENGSVVSPGYTKNTVWTPVLSGDFGINALSYTEGTYASGMSAAAAAAPASGDVPAKTTTTVVTAGESTTSSASPQTNETSASAAVAAAPESDGPVTVTTKPKTGDGLRFDLLLGGDAVDAVLYSENNSVLFDPMEYTESGEVKGRILSDDVKWGIVFMNANGDVLDMVSVAN